MNNQSFCCDGGDLQLFADLGSQSATDSAPTLYFYHPDHLGSTAMVTDLDGRITQNVVYIPYGEVFVEGRNGSWVSPYLFNAKELDEETGLYYYGARYLDPAGARWLSVGPSTPNSGFTVNHYLTISLHFFTSASSLYSSYKKILVRFQSMTQFRLQNQSHIAISENLVLERQHKSPLYIL